MYRFTRILRMDVVNLFTNPAMVGFGTIFPLITIIVLSLISSGNYGIAMSSYDYYGVAGMFFVAANAATFSANSSMEERIKSPNIRIIANL